MPRKRATKETTALRKLQNEDIRPCEALPPSVLVTIQEAQCLALKEAYAKKFHRDGFVEEVAAVARLAATTGDFKSALSGYELLGRAASIFAPESTSQHIHLHGKAVHTLSDAELREIARAKDSPVPEHKEEEDEWEKWLQQPE